MKSRIIKKLQNFFKNNNKNIIITFLVLVIFLVSAGVIYYFSLSPSDDKIQKLVNKYTQDGYCIPYYVAERYLTWYNMRSFFFALHYIFTLLGLFASLMTVYYASNSTDNTKSKKDNNTTIIFLSLLSTCFTISSIFINPGSMAYMAQHAWRELDTCIMSTISNKELRKEEKDQIIIEKVVEMEKYIESYEH